MVPENSHDRKINTGGGSYIKGGVKVERGDFVSRDKITNYFQEIHQRALTKAEEAQKANEIEIEILAHGVARLADNLQTLASQETDSLEFGPYRGLLEYRLADAEIFLGRQKAISELWSRLLRSHLTILHSESGAGKTSLLQAGIAPRLIGNGNLPLILRPYNQNPILAIKQTFLPELRRTPDLKEAPLREFLVEVSSILGKDRGMYILLDQFEEFFTRLEASDQQVFIQQLSACLDDETLPVYWVLALRSEYFSDLAAFQPRIRSPFENEYRLNRLTRTESVDVITIPAELTGVSFENGLVEMILDDLGGQEIAPPQVQLVCLSLYQELKPDQKIITRVLYEQEGKAEGILRSHLGNVLRRQFKPDHRKPAWWLLEALVSSDQQRSVRSRNELGAELVKRGVTNEVIDNILGKLIDSRLIHSFENEEGLAYELAHDYLLKEIEIDFSVRARKSAQELLEQETRAFQVHKTLLDSNKLAIIQAHRRELVIGKESAELIGLSERALKRQQQLLVGGVGVVLILLTLAILSISATFSANRAVNLAQTKQAEAVRQVQFSRFTQEVIEENAASAATQEFIANQVASTAEARAKAANETLRRSFEEVGIVKLDGQPSAVAFYEDKLLVLIPNALQVVNKETGLIELTIPVEGNPADMVIVENRLWIAYPEINTVKTLDPSRGWQGTTIQVGKNPSLLTFDGQLLWVTNRSGFTEEKGWVQSINPKNWQVSSSIDIGIPPFQIVGNDQTLWIANSYGVEAFDATNGKPAGGCNFRGERPVAITLDENILWLLNRTTENEYHLWPLERHFFCEKGSNYVKLPQGSSSAQMVFAHGILFVSFEQSNNLRLIELMTGFVSGPVSVGKQPTILRYDGNNLWVANSGEDTIQKLKLPDFLLFHKYQEYRAPEKYIEQQKASLAFQDTLDQSVKQSTIQVIDPVTKQLILNQGVNQGDVDQPISIEVGSTSDGRQDWQAIWEWDNTNETYFGSLKFKNLKTKEEDSLILGDLPNGLAFDGSRVWVSFANRHKLVIVDPITKKVDSLAIDINPYPVAFDGVRLWFSPSDYLLITKKSGS